MVGKVLTKAEYAKRPKKTILPEKKEIKLAVAAITEPLPATLTEKRLYKLFHPDGVTSNYQIDISGEKVEVLKGVIRVHSVQEKEELIRKGFVFLYDSPVTEED